MSNEVTPTDRHAKVPELKSKDADRWLEATRHELESWAEQREGRWQHFDCDEVVLTIDRADGTEVDRAEILLAHGEVAVGFGHWRTVLPAGQSGEQSELSSAREAMRLVDRWLSGELRTATLLAADGRWCGSVLLDPGPIGPQLHGAAEWAQDLKPARIEVRSAKPDGCATYDVPR